MSQIALSVDSGEKRGEYEDLWWQMGVASVLCVAVSGVALYRARFHLLEMHHACSCWPYNVCVWRQLAGFALLCATWTVVLLW